MCCEIVVNLRLYFNQSNKKGLTILLHSLKRPPYKWSYLLSFSCGLLCVDVDYNLKLGRNPNSISKVCKKMFCLLKEKNKKLNFDFFIRWWRRSGARDINWCIYVPMTRKAKAQKYVRVCGTFSRHLRQANAKANLVDCYVPFMRHIC